MSDLKNHIVVVVSAAKGQPLSAFVKRRARQFLERLALRGVELSISLVGDRRIRSINRQWRDKDKATDVLSFPTGPLPRGFPRPHPIGDIVISIDTAIRAARQEECHLKDEVERYLAHGLLHLLGFDHHSEKEAQAMAQAEDRLLGHRGMVSISRHGRTS